MGSVWLSSVIAWICILIFVIIDIALTCILYFDGWYYCPTIQRGNNLDGMEVFQHATLFPYSGSPYTMSKNLTESQCVNSCMSDNQCLGFTWSPTTSTCSFYSGINIPTYLGPNVGVSSYFLDQTVSLIIGRDLPALSTQVYVKPGVATKQMASVFLQPQIAMLGNFS